MRVLFSDGTLKPIKRVSPLTVKTYEVNGKVRRDFYRSKGFTDNTNGILFATDTNPFADYIFAGNLDKDIVSGIIQTALKNDYIDLTVYNLTTVESQGELANIGDKPFIFESAIAYVNPKEDKLDVMPLSPFIPLKVNNNPFSSSGFDCCDEEDNCDEEGDENYEGNF